MTAVYRVFADKILDRYAHHFLCQIDRGKSLKTAYTEYKKGEANLRNWGHDHGYGKMSLYKLGLLKLTEDLKTHNLYDFKTMGERKYPVWNNAPIAHPLPSLDQGIHYVDCTTDASMYDTDELARLLVQVNNRATNGFMQLIRRRLSVLERPLVTARGEGKSYIYANFNPKYAQYRFDYSSNVVQFLHSYQNKRQNGRHSRSTVGNSGQEVLKDIIYFS